MRPLYVSPCSNSLGLHPGTMKGSRNSSHNNDGKMNFFWWLQLQDWSQLMDICTQTSVERAPTASPSKHWEERFRGGALRSFLRGEWPLCASCQLSAKGGSLLPVNGLSLATVKKTLTRHGPPTMAAGVMMPVWPRWEEVERRNPKEEHSCAHPLGSISAWKHPRLWCWPPPGECEWQLKFRFFTLNL